MSNSNDLTDISNIYNKNVQEYYSMDFIKKMGKRKCIVNLIDEDGPMNMANCDKFINYTGITNEFITTIFRFEKDDLYCNYAFYYKNTIDPKNSLICYGSSLESQDGEFKPRVMPLSILEFRFPGYDIIEQLILQKINDGLNLTFDIFSDNTVAIDKISEEINNNRLVIHLAVLCWFVDSKYIKHTYFQNHVNNTYKYILFDTTDIELVKKIETEIGGSNEMDIMIDKAESIPVTQAARTLIRLCQKLITVPIKGISSPHDTKYDVWNETYIADICFEIVKYACGNGFVPTLSRFYIDGGRRLFDNKSISEKFNQSERATQITAGLLKTDLIDYFDTDKYYPAGDKFIMLSRKIQEAVNYADSAIILDSLVVCNIMSYAGLTFRDYAYRKLIDDANTETISIPTAKDIYENPAFLQKQIFEYLYNILCMNVKLHAIHGDLHINNITMKSDIFAKMLAPDEILCFLYIIDKTSFMMPMTGKTSTIIDFSRSIMYNEDILEKTLPKKYIKAHILRQKNKIRTLFELYFSDTYIENKVIFDKMIEENPKFALKVLSPIDIYRLTSEMFNYFTTESCFVGPTSFIKIDNQILKLVKTLKDDAGDALSDGIHKIISGDVSAIKNYEWPNKKIILKSFGHITEDKTKKYVIYESYNINNEIKFDNNYLKNIKAGKNHIYSEKFLERYSNRNNNFNLYTSKYNNRADILTQI